MFESEYSLEAIKNEKYMKPHKLIFFNEDTNLIVNFSILRLLYKREIQSNPNHPKPHNFINIR